MQSPGDEVRPTGRAGGGKHSGRTLVALDFETYYDKNYTLKKLSTSEYIRNESFEAISMAIKVGDAVTEVVFGHEAIAARLAKVNWSNAALLCHHAHFDGLILSHHFGCVPAEYRCTLSMARALHPKSERNDLGTVAARYGVSNKLTMPDFKGLRLNDLTDEEMAAIAAYNARDVDCMVEVYDRMEGALPESEMQLIDHTVRMFADPVLRLDEDLAKSELDREIAERRAAIDGSGILELAAQAGVSMKPKKKGDVVTAENLLSSNKAFPEVLRFLGVEPPRKISKTTNKETYALSKSDEEFTDLVAHPDPRVVALVNGRLAAKSTIGETRAARLLRAGAHGARLPIYLNYCGAHTMRWSGGDKLNFQNLKKKGRIRHTICAPEGYSIVVIDSAQIEARVLAWLAGEEWLLQAFREGADPYCIMGTDIYGRVITKADKQERFVAKTATLGLGFQMGASKFQMSVLAQSINQGMSPVKLDLGTCTEIVNTYRQKNRAIVAFWGFMQNEVIGDMASTKPSLIHSIEIGLEWGRNWMGLAGHVPLLYPDMRAKYANLAKMSVAERRRLEYSHVVTEASFASASGRTSIYGGMATENIVQYIARHVVAEQMLRIALRHRIVMMTHDEVAYLAPTSEADEALEYGLKIMKTPPAWAATLPVNAEGGHDVIYSK